MRRLLCANKLPPECDTTGLTLANVHWHPRVENWTTELPTSRRFIMEAFGSSEVNPRAFPGPFFLDVEPDALWGDCNSKQFHRWLDIRKKIKEAEAALEQRMSTPRESYSPRVHGNCSCGGSPGAYLACEVHAPEEEEIAGAGATP